VIWDSVDCISHLFEQAARESRNHFGKLVTRLELSRTRHHEGQLLHRFDHVLITSGIDREALLQLGRANGKRLPAARPDGARRPSNGARLARDLTVLPNGVDVTYFKPGDGSRASSTLVFSGKMSYHANVTMALHLAQDIMPRVWARRPEVKLQVVGKNPPRQVLALAAHPAVEVTGMVPDVRPYLQQATLAVAPATYGAGIQNKVLEAMACATPVVASAQAVSALRVKAGEDVMVASEPEAFSDAVVQLLDEPHRQRQLGQAGRRFVEAHHQWDHIVAQLEDVYHGVIRTRG
jgi:glycosyltransferase involved in cell wall biosynthesis